MSLARTTYADSVTYANPYATEYDPTTIPTISKYKELQILLVPKYFAQETGVNKINLNGTEDCYAVVLYNQETLIYLLKVMVNI